MPPIAYAITVRCKCLVDVVSDLITTRTSPGPNRCRKIALLAELAQRTYTLGDDRVRQTTPAAVEHRNRAVSCYRNWQAVCGYNQQGHVR